MHRAAPLALAALFAAVAVAQTRPDAPTSRPAPPSTRPASANPAAYGFDEAGSDPRAIEIADAVMERMGGRAAWDRTRYLTWSFFGYRRHLWDRYTGNVRIEGAGTDGREPYVILMNVHSGRGRAWVHGEEVTGESELARLLEMGRGAWINDAYWLVMPYKLKDTGVTLQHVGARETLDGAPAEVVALTFTGVGLTPGNRYEVYVGAESGLVEQWDFYRDAGDAEPAFRLPWRDWRPHGDILLSGDRGERTLTDIAVLAEVPRAALERPEPVDYDALPRAPSSARPPETRPATRPDAPSSPR